MQIKSHTIFCFGHAATRVAKTKRQKTAHVGQDVGQPGLTSVTDGGVVWSNGLGEWSPRADRWQTLIQQIHSWVSPKRGVKDGPSSLITMAQSWKQPKRAVTDNTDKTCNVHKTDCYGQTGVAPGKPRTQLGWPDRTHSTRIDNQYCFSTSTFTQVFGTCLY